MEVNAKAIQRQENLSNAIAHQNSQFYHFACLKKSLQVEHVIQIHVRMEQNVFQMASRTIAYALSDTRDRPVQLISAQIVMRMRHALMEDANARRVSLGMDMNASKRLHQSQHVLKNAHNTQPALFLLETASVILVTHLWIEYAYQLQVEKMKLVRKLNPQKSQV